MELFRVDIVARAKGYFARSTHREIAAVGASPAEAAENARLMVRALFPKKGGPSMLLVRIHELGCETIVMQPMDRAVSLDSVRDDIQPAVLGIGSKRRRRGGR